MLLTGGYDKIGQPVATTTAVLRLATLLYIGSQPMGVAIMRGAARLKHWPAWGSVVALLPHEHNGTAPTVVTPARSCAHKVALHAPDGARAFNSEAGCSRGVACA